MKTLIKSFKQIWSFYFFSQEIQQQQKSNLFELKIKTKDLNTKVATIAFHVSSFIMISIKQVVISYSTTTPQRSQVAPAGFIAWFNRQTYLNVHAFDVYSLSPAERSFINFQTFYNQRKSLESLILLTDWECVVVGKL